AGGEGPQGGGRVLQPAGIRRPGRPVRPQGRKGVRLRQAADAVARKGRGPAEVTFPQPWHQAVRAGLARSAPIQPTPPVQCASTASRSSATMLVILIMGLTAGPAVSL